MRLTKSKTAWAEQFKPPQLKGGTLHPNAAQADRYNQQLQALVAQMAAQVEREVMRLFKGEAAQEFYAMDASIASQARILLNSLTATFEDLFARRSKPLAKTMVKGAAKASKTALHSSLKELSGGLSLNTGLVPDSLAEALSAAVTENVGLIRTIPSDYLGAVQGAVMRSLQPGGQGLADLVPFMQARKEITQRHARNVALDQTRKAFQSANAARMQALNVQEFEWIHSGGGAHPREDHVKMNGKTYRFDDPPVIGVMYGSEVRGLPGQLPNCRCTMRPVVTNLWGED